MSIKITHSRGVTINVGNYEFERYDVGMEMECLVDDEEKVTSTILKILEHYVDKFVDEINAKRSLTIPSVFRQRNVRPNRANDSASD